MITYAYKCCIDYDSPQRTGAKCPKCGKEGRRLFVVYVDRHAAKGKT